MTSAIPKVRGVAAVADPFHVTGRSGAAFGLRGGPLQRRRIGAPAFKGSKSDSLLALEDRTPMHFHLVGDGFGLKWGNPQLPANGGVSLSSLETKGSPRSCTAVG